MEIGYNSELALTNPAMVPPHDLKFAQVNEIKISHDFDSHINKYMILDSYASFRDVALLRLNNPVNFSNQVQPVCLFDDSSVQLISAPLNAVGYGSFTAGSMSRNIYRFAGILQSQILKTIQMQDVSSLSECKVRPDVICAKGLKDFDTPCKGKLKK